MRAILVLVFNVINSFLSKSFVRPSGDNSTASWSVRTAAVAGIFLGALALTITSPVQATLITLTTADGLGADTLLNGGPENFRDTGIPRRDTNFGAFEFVTSKFSGDGQDLNLDSNFTRITLLRFDLSSINGTVDAATLRLGVKLTELNDQGNPAIVSFTLNLLPDGAALDATPLLGGWDEFGITMSNSALAGLLPTQGVAGAQQVVPPQSTAEFTNATLRDVINDDTNDLITFVIIPLFNSPAGIQFFSKENQEGGLFPTLELEVSGGITSVPSPSTLSLLGIGLAGLCLTRRRRG